MFRRVDPIRDLVLMLNLPSQSDAIQVSLCPLVESSSQGFSSSIKELKIQWNVTSNEGIKSPHNGVSTKLEQCDGQVYDEERFRIEINDETRISRYSNDEERFINEVNDEARSSRNENSKETNRQLSFILKGMPDRSVWVSLNSEATFEKELNMYSLMVPQYLSILNQIFETPTQENEQIKLYHPLFPKFYTGCLNLENTLSYVDENAAIILENLRLSGYENCRRPNLDDYHFKQVLEKLALFHSVGIIIKTDPNYKDAFENLLKTARPFFFGAKDQNISKINAERRQRIVSIVEKFNYGNTVNEKLMEILTRTDNKTLRAPVSCYYSLIHNDLWINNILFKYSDTSEIADVKFLDFQNTNFGSVAKEFVFLLYTSVELCVWSEMDKYVQYYHNSLVKYLAKYFSSKPELQYIVKEYDLDKFREELKTYACHKLKHIFIIMKILHGKDEKLYEDSLRHRIE